MNRYHIYGMKLISDYHFEQLVPYREDGNRYPEITILAGRVPDRVRQFGKGFWEFGRTFSWLSNSTVWIIVEDGRRITYELKEGGNPAHLNCYLLGWGLAMLAMQRGLLAMHCSTVATEQGAIMIAGESGVGKSTLTNAFLQKGYRLMADDMAFVETMPESGTSVYPAFPYQKLCRNVVNQKNYDLSKLIYINEEKDKFLVPYDGEFLLSPMPVKGFLMLGVGGCDTVVMEEKKGVESFQVIIHNLFLRHLLREDLGKPEIVIPCLQMAANVPVAYIGRPEQPDTTDAVIREAFAVTEQWIGAGKPERDG